jgi:hypothetical protein
MRFFYGKTKTNSLSPLFLVFEELPVLSFRAEHIRVTRPKPDETEK